MQDDLTKALNTLQQKEELICHLTNNQAKDKCAISNLTAERATLDDSLRQYKQGREQDKLTIDRLEADVRQHDEKLKAAQADMQKDEQTTNLKHQVTSIEISTRELQNALEAVKAELVEAKCTISTLMAKIAALTGMDVVGSSLIECVERFRDLTTNSLLNLLFSLTEDKTLQDLLVPQLSHIPTHLLINIFPLIANRDCIS
jgi:chromosome segregation ATPase